MRPALLPMKNDVAYFRVTSLNVLANTHAAFSGNHDVVQYVDSNDLTSFRQPVCDLDIFAARGMVSGWVIVGK